MLEVSVPAAALGGLISFLSPCVLPLVPLYLSFLAGVTPDSMAASFTADANISELVYFCFQMTFAAITPGLIVGAFAERTKFAAIALFIPLWVTLIYFPIAHMVWYWAGPDAIVAAAKAVAAAAPDAGRARGTRGRSGPSRPRAVSASARRGPRTCTSPSGRRRSRRQTSARRARCPRRPASGCADSRRARRGARSRP